MALKQGKFVLENRYGQVVRTFQWQQPQLTLIYRHDTRRVEAAASTKELARQGVAFDVIAELKREQIKKAPVRIAGLGQLKYVENGKLVLAPRVNVIEDDKTDYLVIFKWTALSYLLFIGFVMTLGYFLKPAEPQEQVVKIISLPESHESLTQLEQEHPKKAVTVDASETKPAPVKNQVAQVSKTSRKIKEARPQVTHSNVRATGSHPARPGFIGPQSGDPSQAGVLGVLGSENRAATGRGGFNPANAKSTGGFGAGKGGGGYGGNGEGGIPRAIFSHGMIAANPGSGSGAPGAGGYGRAGFGGGGRTGYGHLSMVGATKAYFSPIEEEALVEGGLDRDAIAEVIQRNMGQIVYCYEQGLQVKSNLAGRVGVQFVINARGRVATASVGSSSLHYAAVERCIVSKLKTWQFPTPKGGVNVRVSYPFALRRVSTR